MLRQANEAKELQTQSNNSGCNFLLVRRFVPGSSPSEVACVQVLPLGWLPQPHKTQLSMLASATQGLMNQLIRQALNNDD